MKTITKYKTDDGIEFSTEQACKLYEEITNKMDEMLKIQDSTEQNSIIYYVSCYAQKLAKS